MTTKATKEYQRAFDRKFSQLQRQEILSGGHKYDDNCVCSGCERIFREVILFSCDWKPSKKKNKR